jgi:AraC family transcriptional regulator, arabinose operon regulatory protein
MVPIAKTCQKLLMSAAAIEFLSVGEIMPQRDWHMPMHHHPVHELIVILSGRMLLETERQVIRAGPGDLLLYRAGVAHRETSDEREPVHTYFISFKAGDGDLEGLALRIRDADARVRQMVSWMMRDHQAGVRPVSQAPLLRAVLNEAVRLSATPTDPWLLQLRDQMQRRLKDTVYLADLARLAHMSKFAFVRKFKRLSGRTPMQELQRMRLNQARTMMLSSGLPVKAIAAAVGLSDEYQLSKLFRRHFRLSPREMRTRSGGSRKAMQKKVASKHT